MKDLSLKIGRNEWLELGLAIAVLIAATIIPSKIALISTAIFFALYAFFKPFQSLVILIPYVIFRSFFIELNPGMKLIGDLITFIVLLRLFLLNVKNFKSFFFFKKFELAFFAFLIFGAVIGYVNGVGLNSILFQVRTFLIMYLLYYVLSRSKLPANFFAKLAWMTYFSGVILFVQGIVEKLSMRTLWMPEVWTQKVLSSTNFVRIYGLLNNPNSLALVMFFSICAIAFLRFMYKDQQFKYLFIVSQVAFAGLLLLTLSRGAWIASVTFIIFFLLFERNKKLMKNIALTFVAAIVLVYLPTNLGLKYIQTLGIENVVAPEDLSGGISNRFAETFDEDTLALMNESGRMFYIKKGFEVLKDYPLTGAGFGTFGGSSTLSYDSPIYEKYNIRSDIYGGKNFYSDNQYIQVIAETGAIGVLLFAAFLLTMVWLFWQERRALFGKYMFALWVATGVCGFFYNIWELKVYTMFFFIIFAIFASNRHYYPMLELNEDEQ